MHALPVDSRLVRDYHSRFEARGVEILPYVLGPFVNPQEPAYPVSRAVPEVAQLLPQGEACQRIQAASGG